MNPNQNSQAQSNNGPIHESQILPGTIKPRHLAASITMAKGDIYYVNASGIFQRLPIGTNGQTLKVVNGIPAWG